MTASRALRMRKECCLIFKYIQTLFYLPPNKRAPLHRAAVFIHSYHLCQKHVIRSTAQGMTTLSHLPQAVVVFCGVRGLIHHRNKQDLLEWLLSRAGLVVVFMEVFFASPATGIHYARYTAQHHYATGDCWLLVWHFTVKTHLFPSFGQSYELAKLY